MTKNTSFMNIQERPNIRRKNCDNKITYGQLFEEIKKTASAFWKRGIRKGDIVSVCSVSTPEIIYVIYALNKIGATDKLQKRLLVSRKNIKKSKNLY